MSKITLWLIRHGESCINAGTWHANPANASLTELGKQQAELAATQITTCPTLIITSPLRRAQESGQYIIKSWPQVPTEIWPIQELIYLSPEKLQHLSLDEKKEQISAYWQKNDPLYCDGKGAESFASFVERVRDFHTRILAQQGFVVAIGHGLFFKAYQFGLSHGFQTTPAWMKSFRETAVMHPIQNSEILEIIF